MLLVDYAFRLWFWFVLLTDKPPLEVAIVYLVLILGFQRIWRLSEPEQDGITVNDNGRMYKLEKI